MCPYKPLAIGTGSILDIKDRNGISFSGFPKTIDVKPFKQMKFLSDGSNAIVKSYTDLTLD